MQEAVKKSHPPVRLLARAALIMLQKQSRDREGADIDFFTASQE